MAERIFAWLGDLPLAALYAAIGALSAFENFFPPFPSDAVIAFGSFLVARARGSLLIAFGLGWVGNVAGAMITYVLARRYGSAAVLSRLERFGGPGAEERLTSLYARFGMAALFVSRFLPGARAIVPPFAGAMRWPAVPVFLAISAASGVWFGLITFLAFKAGDSWDMLRSHLTRSGKIVGIVAVVIAASAIGLWALHKRKAADD